MRKIIAAALIALTATTVCTPAQARSHKEQAALQFEQLWTERLNGYRQQAQQTAAAHKAAVEVLVSKPYDFNDASDDRMSKFISAADGDAYVGGRGQELEAFLAKIKTRPSAGILQAYLQGRISDLGSKGAMAEQKRKDMITAAGAGHRVGDLYVAIETASMARGDVAGRSDELKLLIENAGSYLSDYADASRQDADRRARIGAALGAFGRAISQQSSAWPKPITCIGQPPMVVCQ
jgi:hypothetical protein